MNTGCMVKLRSRLKKIHLRVEDGHVSRTNNMFFSNEIAIILKKKEVKVDFYLNLTDMLVYLPSGKIGWIYAKDLEMI